MFRAKLPTLAAVIADLRRRGHSAASVGPRPVSGHSRAFQDASLLRRMDGVKHKPYEQQTQKYKRCLRRPQT
jgi:hypothetical protein